MFHGKQEQEWERLTNDAFESAEESESTALQLYVESRCGFDGKHYSLAPQTNSEEQWRFYCKVQNLSLKIKKEIYNLYGKWLIP